MSNRLGWTVCALVLFVSVPLHAQSSGDDAEEGERADEGRAAVASEDASRGRRVVFEEVDGAIRRPEGWVDTVSGDGALATFRSASDSDAQIEVRASSSIGTKKYESFFNSFHSELKRAGFSEVRERTPTTYGGNKGHETEYEGNSQGGTFRLVIWTFYRDETAWILAGFFPKKRRDSHYEKFRELAKTLETSAGD